MPLPAWPAGLPYSPRRWSVAESQRPVLESEMQNGRVRARPVSTLTIGKVQFGFLWSIAEFETFVTFVKTTLGQGAQRFTMPCFNGRAFPTRTVRLRNGGAYSFERIGKSISVTFELDVEGL